MCMLPGNFGVENRAVLDVISTATNPPGVVLPLPPPVQVLVVLIQPSLPKPRLFGAFWYTLGQAHTFIVPLTYHCIMVAATTAVRRYTYGL